MRKNKKQQSYPVKTVIIMILALASLNGFAQHSNQTSAISCQNQLSEPAETEPVISVCTHPSAANFTFTVNKEIVSYTFTNHFGQVVESGGRAQPGDLINIEQLIRRGSYVLYLYYPNRRIEAIRIVNN